MTADDRYGPYGWRENEEGYIRSRVEWDKVDWADLQNACLTLNAARFPDAEFVSNTTRFRLRRKTYFWEADDALPMTGVPKTGRTALVLRAWAGFMYTEKDLVHLRSLITEAALGTGGEYAVF